MANQIKAPINYPIIAGGKIVSGGTVLFGQPNVKPDEDNPATLKAVYLDAGLTQQAENPQGISSDGVFDQADTGILYGSDNTVYSIVIRGANKKELSYIPEYDLNDANAAAAAQESASQAAASESNAIAAKNLTEALYTDFTNRYFGAYSADPSVDDLGSPPSEGSIYFNTVSDVFYTWDGSAWMNYFPSSPNGLMVTATGTTTPRSLANRFAQQINVKDYGAIGDYTTDDTAAINKAFASANVGDVVYFPRGVYGYTGSLDLPVGVHIKGDGAPNMQPAPLLADDKIYMRPNYKHLIPASSIVFKGSADKNLTTTRSDRFSSFSYAVKTAKDAPIKIEGIGFIQDMDVLNASGSLTTPATDNRADYDAGLIIDDSGHNKLIDVCLFGYWSVTGGAILSQGFGANPDYNYFTQCSFTGDIGFSLVGHDALVNGTEGLSGTTFVECKLYSRNHHDRTQTDPAELGTHILYIDGFITANNKISGHKFIGCELRSAVEYPIQLDNCEDVAFIGCNTEMTNNALYPGTVKYISGTLSTKRVIINSCRMFSSFLEMRRLSTEIEGPLLIDEDSGGVSYFVKNGMGIRLGASDEISNDPVINMSRGDFNGITKEWAIRYGVSGDLDINYNNTNKLKLDQDGNLTLGGMLKGITSTGTREVRTISAGNINLLRSSSLVAIASEGGAATDDLISIGSGQQGDIIILTAFSGSQTIVVKDGTNIRLAGGIDFSIDNNEDTIMLIYTASNYWVELSRSDNGA